MVTNIIGQPKKKTKKVIALPYQRFTVHQRANSIINTYVIIILGFEQAQEITLL